MTQQQEDVALPPRRYKGSRDSLSQAILNALITQGPMTTGELCLALGRNIREVASVVSRMRKYLPTLPKRVYVHDWVYEDEYSPKYFARARYAVGEAADKKKPRPDPKGARMRHYYKSQVPNSIFDVATTRKVREQRQRNIRAEYADRRGSLQETQDSADGIQHGEQP